MTTSALRVLDNVVKYDERCVEIPAGFVEECLSSSACLNPLYAVVYLFAIHYGSNEEPLCVSFVAKRLEISEQNVIAALEHWKNSGILEYAYEGGIVRIRFGNEKPSEPQISDPPCAAMPKENQDVCEPAEEKTPSESSPAGIYLRPEYTPQELEIYRDNEEVRLLFEASQKHLGRLLSYSDMNCIFSLYDWLRLPPNVIDVLLKHCCEAGHTNMAYIEKAALDWSARGIDTPEKAVGYIQMFGRDFREIMKAFGISGRNPSASEAGFMTSWLQELDMPLDMLLKACDQTVIKTGGISFAYADKIVKRWNSEGIRDLASALATEEAFKQATEDGAPKPKRRKASLEKPKPTSNRFANFEQRQNDFDKMEREAMERLHKKHGIPTDPEA